MRWGTSPGPPGNPPRGTRAKSLLPGRASHCGARALTAKKGIRKRIEKFFRVRRSLQVIPRSGAVLALFRSSMARGGNFRFVGIFPE